MKFINVVIPTISMIALMYVSSVKADPWHGYTKITILYPSAGAAYRNVQKAITPHVNTNTGKTSVWYHQLVPSFNF
jgi:hypothetical protein